ncbi:MAG: YegS/Rv2252/BmrU family lipid kinase [Bacteroidetes bacterium]|nr:YegS/Rv2252/BmrU family lipid kinase [Bacteroidota bacterium]
MKKKKICFIVNPISGVGRQMVVEKLIDQHLNRTLFDYEIVYTKAAKHATELAKQAVANNFNIVVAVGGDGSVNEVARGLIGSSTAMAIMPAGSGNGFARHMNIPLDLKKAMNIINNAKEASIDTIQLNNETFINVAGVGFDAHIGWEFAKFGKRGFSSYLKVIIREFPKFKVQDYELIINGQPFYKKAFLISFANGSQWGNNAYIAPLADVADGYMDIAILKNFSFWNVISIGYKLLRKTIHLSPHLETIKAKEVVVKQANTIAHIDGEPIEVGHSISIKVNPLSLRVIIP